MCVCVRVFLVGGPSTTDSFTQTHKLTAPIHAESEQILSMRQRRRRRRRRRHFQLCANFAVCLCECAAGRVSRFCRPSPSHVRRVRVARCECVCVCVIDLVLPLRCMFIVVHRYVCMGVLHREFLCVTDCESSVRLGILHIHAGRREIVWKIAFCPYSMR